MSYDQFIRKISLVVYNDDKGLDLSAFRIKFSVQNADVETPNNITIRVYNLSKETINKLIQGGEFSRVELSAGYENGNFGKVFQGNLMQFRVGRESPTDTYLDILAADGDAWYNQAILNTSIAKGATPQQVMSELAKAGPGLGTDFGSLKTTMQYTPSIRGQVMFGMARARMRNMVSSLDAGWSIQDGKIVVVDNTGYRDDGPPVKINVATGMIGMPEQQNDGIHVTCLLNSHIRIGSKIHLNKDEINQLLYSKNNPYNLPYNQWTGAQPMAPLSADGYYRAFVVEHEGDTRGDAWYTKLICLAIDETSPAATAVSKQ